ncbi:MAG: hypothetical protein E7325_05330 [Clostridiales bacterium]|nr:hypothetical protein [Clostridiales bacterium]
MNIKKAIKNGLWRYTYILPFARKYKLDEKGKVELIQQVVNTYKMIKPVRTENSESTGANIKELLSQIDIDLTSNSRFIYFLDTSKTIAIPGNILSNFTLSYDKVIHGTFTELASNANGNDEYGKEAKLVAEGIEILVNRIIELLEKSNHPNKRTLLNYFHRILTKPAEHLDEALQRVLFFNQILWQTKHRLNGLGRLDVILEDYYNTDIGNGIIDEQEARGMIDDFLTVLGLYSQYKSDTLQGDIGQIIILGGLDSEKNYFFNDLTALFLQEQAHLHIPDPKILLRVSKETPEELLGIAIESLSAKTGSPLFSNDDVVIPALIDSGVEIEDAYQYCVSACWEPLVVGKSIAQNNIGVLDYFKALDETLEEDANSFEELLEKYIKKCQNRLKNLLQEIDTVKWAKDPFVSMFMDGCSESRNDISTGHCRYPNYGITTVALSNTIDSLINIKTIVYDKNEYTLKQLNEARKNNFNEANEIYNLIAGERKSFGHDHDMIIDLTNRITDSMADILDNYTNHLGGKVKIGLSSPDYNIISKKTAGDFSGRKHGMPYNTHISCIDAAYTEVINFAGNLKYDKLRYNGNVVDFFVPPALIENNADQFLRFVRGAILSGFFQMQMNVLDSKTLIDAKEHPEKYGGLIVRVWGFSAYFNDLPESYKDLMIERATAAEKIA